MKALKPIESANVCDAHCALLETLTKISVNLGWVVKLGFVLIPLILLFLASYVDLRQQVVVNAGKLNDICEQVTKHIDQQSKTVTR